MANASSTQTSRFHAPSRAMVTTCLGFGLFLAWMMIGITPSIYVAPAAQTIAHMNDAELIGKLIGVVPLVLLGLLSRRKVESFPYRTVTVAVGAIMSLSTAAVYLAAGTEGTNAAIDFFATLAFAASITGIALCAERLWAFDANEALACVALAHLLAYVITFALATLHPYLMSLAHLSLPIVAFLVLEQNDTLPHRPKVRAAGTGVWDSPLRALIGIGVFGAIIQATFQLSENKSSDPNEALWLAAGMAVCTLALVVVFFAGERLRVYSLSKLLLPLFIVGEFAIFAFDLDQLPIEILVVGFAWTYFRLHYFSTWRIAMLRTDASPFFVVALGQSLLTLGCALGGATCFALERLGVSGFAVLACLCVFTVIAAAVFFDTRYISTLEGAPMPTFDPTDDAVCAWCVDRATEQYGLTRQERSVALMLVKGESNTAMVEALCVTPATLKSHLRNMYKRCGVHSREELVLLLRSVAK